MMPTTNLQLDYLSKSSSYCVALLIASPFSCSTQARSNYSLCFYRAL